VDKAPDAFRTISEVAEELDVPQHVLRFWETRFPQIKPMKRGGGRRYYRPDDVELLRGIRHLLYGEGYTIRGVQGQIKEKGLKFVQGVWRQDAGAPARPAEDAGGSARTTTAVERLEEDEAEAVEAAVAAEKPSPRTTVTLPRATPRPQPATAAPAPAARLGEAERQRLEAVLSELAECRRLLDAALKDTE
jgi:DNA-binding transcriptional MerR regulator